MARTLLRVPRILLDEKVMGELKITAPGSSERGEIECGSNNWMSPRVNLHSLGVWDWLSNPTHLGEGFCQSGEGNERRKHDLCQSREKHRHFLEVQRRVRVVRGGKTPADEENVENVKVKDQHRPKSSSRRRAG